MLKRLLNRITGKNKIQNRKVTKARFLYLYIIFGSIAGLGYFVTALVLNLPKHFAFTPLYLLVVFIILRFLYKNWRMIFLYITDIERGKLLLFLNDHTHFIEEHKLKLIKWVYLPRKTTRLETRLKLANKVMDKVELTDREKLLMRYRTVYCPQQLRDGFNEALLVNTLIYAHQNIQVLDEDLRNLMDLTDEHILAFDLKVEHDKISTKEYDRLIEVGKKVTAKK